MKKLFAVGALTSFLLAVIASTCAQAAEEAFDFQKKYERALFEYNKENIGRSADIFSEIVEYLKAQKAEKLSKFFPAAPEAWKEKPTDNSGGKAGNLARLTSKTYLKDEDSVSVSLVTDNRLMNAISALMTLANTVSEDGTPNKEIKYFGSFIYRFGKEKNSEDYTLNLFVSDRLLVNISGAKLTEALALEFVKKLDLQNLKIVADK